AFAVACDREDLSVRAQMHVQPVFRHIDADKHRISLPSLRMRARSAAPATVRDHKSCGRSTPLRDGLCSPRCDRASFRHRNPHLTMPTRPLLDTRCARRARLEGWRQTPSAWPSFETPASRAPQDEGYPNLPRSCFASKSSAGPSGTMPVGLMCSMLM